MFEESHERLHFGLTKRLHSGKVNSDTSNRFGQVAHRMSLHLLTILIVSWFLNDELVSSFFLG